MRASHKLKWAKVGGAPEGSVNGTLQFFLLWMDDRLSAINVVVFVIVTRCWGFSAEGLHEGDPCEREDSFGVGIKDSLAAPSVPVDQGCWQS